MPHNLKVKIDFSCVLNVGVKILMRKKIIVGGHSRRNGRELHSHGRRFLCLLNLNCFAKLTEIKVDHGMMFFFFIKKATQGSFLIKLIVWFQLQLALPLDNTYMLPYGLR